MPRRQLSDLRCVHCKKFRPHRPRGLCERCYYDPEIVKLYPKTSKFARRGVGFNDEQSDAEVTPTKSLPGTADKIDVLSERAALGLPLFHPFDGDFAHED